MPALPLQLRTLVPLPVTLAGVRLHTRPLLGEIAELRATVPAKPLTGATLIVDVPETAGVVLTVVGLAKIWKSWTLTVITEVV